MAYTTTELVTNIKSRGAIPTSQNTFTTTKFLQLADDVLRSFIVPNILEVRESFYSKDKDYTISSVNYPNGYSIPSRASGAKLQDVILLDSNGHRQSAVLVTEDQVEDSDLSPAVDPAFYIKNNKIILVPAEPSNYTTLRLSYFVRPGTLVETSSAAQITAIDTGTNTLTFSALPSSFTTNTPLDLLKETAHFEHLAIDQTPSSVTSTTLVFSSLPSDLAVGDWVSLAGESPIPQIPQDCRPILEQRVANICMRIQGSNRAAQEGEEAVKLMEENVYGMLSPRVEREPKKIVGRNGFIK